MLTVELNRKINPDSVVTNAFRPYAGTQLRKVCIEKGLIPKEESVLWKNYRAGFLNIEKAFMIKILQETQFWVLTEL